MKTKWLIGVGVLLALLLAACGGGDDPASPSQTSSDQPEATSQVLYGTTPGRPALVEFYADW